MHENRRRGSASHGALVDENGSRRGARRRRATTLRRQIDYRCEVVKYYCAAVAQRNRASVFGTEGRGFESLQPHSAVDGVQSGIKAKASGNEVRRRYVNLVGRVAVATAGAREEQRARATRGGLVPECRLWSPWEFARGAHAAGPARCRRDRSGKCPRGRISGAPV